MLCRDVVYGEGRPDNLTVKLSEEECKDNAKRRRDFIKLDYLPGNVTAITFPSNMSCKSVSYVNVLKIKDNISA